ncbi:coiled-coil domain-containing protein 201 [Caretta caretta]|uniref:coiled-coil domain-containing protein 201 n=1 Tax=Caretta caretta TaxID=8467 RepID=UPI002094EDCA|nr:coiled-coil domain-containing protein 201 [Caretta caretta]
MSAEEDSFLNVKRSLKKAAVKHSTPVDSVFSQSMLSLVDMTNQSIREQNISKRIYGSPMPKSSFQKQASSQEQLMHLDKLISQVTFPRKLSTVLDPEESSEEMSHSSWAAVPRRRLSTVLASEESSEEPSFKTMVPPIVSAAAEVPAEPSKKTAKVTSKSVFAWLVTEIPGIKDPSVRKRRKRKFEKNLLEAKQQEWELRQLKNIEEATRHELTIEEI